MRSANGRRTNADLICMRNAGIERMRSLVPHHSLFCGCQPCNPRRTTRSDFDQFKERQNRTVCSQIVVLWLPLLWDESPLLQTPPSLRTNGCSWWRFENACVQGTRVTDEETIQASLPIHRKTHETSLKLWNLGKAQGMAVRPHKKKRCVYVHWFSHAAPK